MTLLVSGPALSQGNICEGDTSWTSPTNGPGQEDNCDATGENLRCYPPLVGAPSFTLANPSCDPMAGPCDITVKVPIDFLGNHQNPQGNSTRAQFVVNFMGGFFGSCGAPFAAIANSQGNATWSVTASCADSPESGIYHMLAKGCPFVLPCDRVVSRLIPTAPAGTPLCGAEPPPPPCNDNCLGCVGGGGGAPVTGGGGTASPLTGPGATLRHLAGGVGHPGFPGSAGWTRQTGLAAYWAHEYVERIIEDPDESHVWLITREGGYVEFEDPELDGTYDVLAPSDDYRLLTKTVAGWELLELDGSVQAFEELPGLPGVGLWIVTTDRNGQETTATYDATSLRLVAVDFPDGLREEFVYPGGSMSFPGYGLLSQIVEKGIDGSTKATWSYEWTRGAPENLEASGLMRVNRPDGTAVEFFYNDDRFPGYLTRLEEVDSTGTNRRITGGWAYDSLGRVTDTWKGDTDTGASGEDVPGVDARERYHLDFDTPTAGFTTVTSPEGAVIEYEVDTDPTSSKPRVLGVTGASCSLCGFAPESSFEYDDVDNPMRPTTVFDGKGHRTDYAYDDNGQVLTKTEAIDDPNLTRVTSFTYDADFPAFVTQITQPSATQPGMSRLTLMDYDPTTGDLGTRTIQGFEDSLPAGFDCGSAGSFDCDTTFQYNDAGQVEVIDPPGFGTGDQTLFQYPAAPDPRGGFFPEERTDPVGTTAFAYDAFNRRVRVTDPNLVDVDTQYDALNRVRFVIQRGASGTDPGDPGNPGAGDLVTEHVYDVYGQLFRTILPEGNVIEYLYDEVGRLVSIERRPNVSTAGEKTVFVLDDAGNRVQEQLFDASSALVSETTYEYESGCQLTKIIRGSNGPAPSTTEYDHDCNGNLTDVWDANHPRGSFPTAPLRYAYDALNRLEQVNQTSGGSHPASAACDGTSTTDLVTCYGYDVQDHLVEVEDAERNVTEYTYSDRDLLTDQDSQATGPSSLSYNEHGELVSETDARNVTVTRVVDAADRVTSVDYPDNTLDTTYAYGTDPMEFDVGRLVGITRDGETVAYAYDRFGRVLQDGALTYTYDANGNQETIGYPGGVTATYGYDASDRAVSLSVPGQTLVSAATYAPSGPLTGLTLGNGLTEARTFDARYFPEAIELADASPLVEWSYTVDAVGNILAIEDLVSSDPADDRTFDYQDHQYFLSCAAGPWIPEGASCDPPSTDPVPFQWTYDRIGNRLTEQREEPPDELVGLLPQGVLVDEYVYELNADSGNSAILDEVDLGEGASRLYAFGPAGHLEELEAGANVVAVTTDAAGRISRFQRSATGGGTLAAADVTYDGRGFLREVTSLQTVIFQDGFETGDTACWSSTAGDAGENVVGGCPPPPSAGPAVEAVYDSQGTLHGIVRTPSGGSPVTELVFYFADRPIAQLTDDATTQSWQLLTTDHLGTPIAGTDDAGALLWEGGLEPFGASVETGTFLRLPGQWTDLAWQDAASGLNPVYNVYRWYEQGTGRYTTSEVLGYPAEIGRYTYATSNPLNALDRLGLLSEPPDNLIPFPGNPNPYPTKPPWECDDVRPFDPTRVPRQPVFDPKRILRISGRAIGTAALAIVNVKIWTCGISRIYCMTQSSGLTPCECMGSMDPGGSQCAAIPSSPSLRCPPTPEPVEPPPCCTAPSR